MKSHLGNENECEQLHMVLKQLGDVWQASQNPEGCWVVQKLPQICCKEDVLNMFESFKGRIWEAVDHMHAHYVLSAMCNWAEGRRLIIEECSVTPRPLPAHLHDPTKTQLYLATHRFFCRILPRITEHDGKMDYVMEFIEKVLDQSEEARGHHVPKQANLDLCSSNYGHHVACSILEKGAPQHQHRIVRMLKKGTLMAMATNRHASYVIEDVLKYAHVKDKEEIIYELIKKENIMALATNQYGWFVLSNLAQVKHDDADDDEDLKPMNQAESEAEMLNANLMKTAMQIVKTVLLENKEQLTTASVSERKHAKKLFDQIFEESTAESQDAVDPVSLAA